MSDLISRQAMLDGIDKLIKIHFDRTVVLYKARKVAEDLPSVQPETNCSEIPNNCPAADVVPVVRCDDCVYYGSRRWCELHSSVFDDNAFCSYGERKVGKQDG